MSNDHDSTSSDPRNQRNPPEEFFDLAQDEEIAEGDVTVSETQSGNDPMPELDDRDSGEDTLGEDDLIETDVDDPAPAWEDDNPPDQPRC